MCDHQHRGPFATPTSCAGSAQGHTDTAEARAQYEQPGDERDELGRQRLHCLEKWICELLIKNQELRTSLLNSTINHQSREADQ